jgi:hypothetical protein
MKQNLKLKVAKIVGSSDEKRWVQVHTFYPEEEEKIKKRGILLAVLSLVEKEEEEEGVGVVEVGREVISRLHEEYYGNLEGETFEGLKRAVEKVKGEWGVEIVAGAVVFEEDWGVLYLAAGGGGRVIVQRGETMGEILKSQKERIETASGYLEEGDVFVLGNEGFFGIVSSGVLKGFLGTGEAEEIVDGLAPMIHGREEGVGAGAVVGKVVMEEERNGEVIEEVEEKKEKKEGVKEKLVAGLVFGAGRLEDVLERLLTIFSKRRGVYVRGEGERRGKGMMVTVVVLMILLLVASIFFGLKKRKGDEGVRSWEEVRVLVEERIGQAESLAELNPIRAKEIVNEARGALEEWREKSGKDGGAGEIEELQRRLSELGERVEKKYELTTAEVFWNLNLIREGTVGERMALYKNQLVILDKKSEVVLDLDIKTKEGKILVGRLGKVDLASVFLGKAFYPVGRAIFFVDLESKNASKAGEISEEVGEMVDFVAYAGNVYVLDRGNGQIWKFPGIEGGLGAARKYLEGSMSELKGGVSMAIDGSIWVLTEEGLIYKFTQNRRERFMMTGLEEDFGKPVAIYTDDDCDKLYVLDKGKTRVVVIGKEGEYEAQYVWQGIAGVEDMVISEKEGKILLLSESKLFELKLK